MRVAYIIRSTANSSYGGDTTQLLGTAKYMKRTGVEVDIKLTHEPIDYDQYDLLHFFNIIRPDDILRHIGKTEKPFVVSSIFLDYSFYTRQPGSGLRSLVFRLFSPDNIEYAKRMGRVLFNREKLPTMHYLLYGHKRSIEHILKRCSYVLPNSASELKRLSQHYKRVGKAMVVPNGIDTEVFDNSLPAARDQRKILCVGRIEIRKNQLNLIKALNDTEFKLHIVGKASPNHQPYLDECKQIASENIQFSERLTGEELANEFKSSKVHILPSWFETTGLSSLEAAWMGCNVVVTEMGDTREYFQDDAFYCQPNDIAGILHAVRLAASKADSKALVDRIRQHYTWQAAAQKTKEAYERALEL